MMRKNLINLFSHFSFETSDFSFSNLVSGIQTSVATDWTYWGEHGNYINNDKICNLHIICTYIRDLRFNIN